VAFPDQLPTPAAGPDSIQSESPSCGKKAMKPMRTTEIRQAMKGVPGWRRKGSIVSRTYEFKDFAQALRFVNQVARAAEKANHHPDIDIRWNKVKLALTTHDAGGLTRNDFALAGKADHLDSRLRGAG
jgi:4a-hydroxytetrahydrobiopterin dehydratase